LCHGPNRARHLLALLWWKINLLYEFFLVFERYERVREWKNARATCRNEEQAGAMTRATARWRSDGATAGATARQRDGSATASATSRRASRRPSRVATASRSRANFEKWNFFFFACQISSKKKFLHALSSPHRCSSCHVGLNFF